MGPPDEAKTMGWYWIKRHEWTPWEAAYCPYDRGNEDRPACFLRVGSHVLCKPFCVGPRIEGMPEDDE